MAKSEELMTQYQQELEEISGQLKEALKEGENLRMQLGRMPKGRMTREMMKEHLGSCIVEIQSKVEILDSSNHDLVPFPEDLMRGNALMKELEGILNSI